MRIAILGWGSLLWDPRELEIKENWMPNGPILPIEFSRVSQDGRITLVIDETDGIPTQSAYAESLSSSIAEARLNLQLRERVPSIESIGYSDLTTDAVSTRATNLHSVSVKSITTWARIVGFDGVIWTALKPQFEEKSGEVFTPDAALRHVCRLPITLREPAFTYVRKAPAMVETPVRGIFRRYEHAASAAHYRNFRQ